MTKQQIQKWFSTEEPVKFYYAGKWYAFFRASNGSFLFIFEVEDENYKFITTEVYNELMDYIVSSKMEEITNTLQQEINDCLLSIDIDKYENRFLSREMTPDQEKRAFQRLKKLFLITCLTYVTGNICLSGIESRLYQVPSYQEMIDDLEMDDRTVSEILSTKMDNGDKDDQYIDAFLERCETFYTHLDDNSKRLFKEKLSNVDIQFQEGKVTSYADSVLSLGNLDDEFALEVSLCAMLNNCNYVDSAYYPDSDHLSNSPDSAYLTYFSWCSNILFLADSYPDEITYTKSEKLLYYKILLYLIDPELDYLPFGYSFSDFVTDLGTSTNKSQEEVNADLELLFSIFDADSFGSGYSSMDFEYYVDRHTFVQSLITSFMNKEKDFCLNYDKNTKRKKNSQEIEQVMSTEVLSMMLASRYTQFDFMLEEINRLTDMFIYVYDSMDLKDSYRAMLKELYPKTWWEVYYRFSDYIDEYSENGNINVVEVAEADITAKKRTLSLL